MGAEKRKTSACTLLNTFMFAMENLWLDLYRNIHHYAKTNFFHTRGKAAIMYLTHMRPEVIPITDIFDHLAEIELCIPLERGVHFATF